MVIRVTSYNFSWKPVKGGSHTKEKQVCPRCNNKVDYVLSWDSEGIGIAGFNLLNTRKVYAFKCPICPHFEHVSNEVAKAIIKG